MKIETFSHFFESTLVHFQIIHLDNSLYIYIADQQLKMDNLFFSIQTPYVFFFFFYDLFSLNI